MKRIIPAILALLLCVSLAMGQRTAVKVLNNGPDSRKLVFLVLAEGYAQSDQAKFASDVKSLVIDGMLAHDFYKQNQKAFNVYRVDLVSQDSGVSHPGQPKRTVLATTYTGSWNDCWIRTPVDGLDRLGNVIRSLTNVPKWDFLMVLLNEPGYGGCARGRALYVTSGAGWAVTAHEYGHGIGGLYDEYSALDLYDGPDINEKNTSNAHTANNMPDRNSVVWKSLILPGTPVPTTLGPGIDRFKTVGMFEGGNTYARGIYRPVSDCRMTSNEPEFCPVCAGIMQDAVDPYLTSPAPPPLNVRPRTESYVRLVVRVYSDGRSEVLTAKQGQGSQPFRPAGAGAPPIYAATAQMASGEPTITPIDVDPFIDRSFPDFAHGKGHMISHSTSGIIVVDVKGQTLPQLMSAPPSIQLYKLPDGVNSINASILAELRNAKKVQMSFKIPAKDVLGQIHGLRNPK